MNIKQKLTFEDFIEMEELELRYYSSEHVTPHEEAYKWHIEFPNAGVVLEDQGKIIAFIDMLPVKEYVFQGILKGTFNDKYLTTSDLVKMESLKNGESVNLLLSCIVVDEEYRKTEALKVLLEAQLSYYDTFMKQGIIIENIITSNVTKQGEHFSEKMGFHKVGISHHLTTIYLINYQSFLDHVIKL